MTNTGYEPGRPVLHLDVPGEVMRERRCLIPTGATHTRFGEAPAFQEGLYEVADDLYAWMVPNGSWGETNAGLIVGDGEALLVDTFWDYRCTQTMLDAVETVLGGTALTHVVNTHADGDHFWGNSLVESAEIVSSSASYAEMVVSDPRFLTSLGRIGTFLSAARILRADRVGQWFQAMVAPYEFRGIRIAPARRTFRGELTLTVGGRGIQLIEVGPAHTSGDTLVYVPDAKVLFSGDVVFADSTPVMWAGPIANWLLALDRTLALDFDVVVPGHGPMTDRRGVELVRDYWEFLQVEIRRLYGAGKKAAAAAREIVHSSEFARRPFAHWNSPERIMVSTHIEYRHLAGLSTPPGKLTVLGIMRRQALLAHELHKARPAALHKT